MNQFNRVSTPAHVFAPDLESELMHWRGTYPDAPCFRSGLGFERYAATLKFGYDTFLLNHMKRADELFPRLCHQYKDGIAACDRIDWVEAQMIIAATWERMQGSGPPPVAVDHEPVPPLLQGTARPPSSGFPQWKWLFARFADLHASPTGPRQAAVL